MDAQAWDERYANGELVWSATPNQFVAEALADLRPGRALDLAAGEGRNALWLAARGWDVTAVDFSAAGLAKGQRLEAATGPASDTESGTGRPVSWVVADVLDYDTGPDPMDLALLAYLQLPADERRTAVRRGFASLREGGTFFLVAHDSTNLTEGTGGPQDAAVLYTAEEVLADLDGERFEVLRAERVARRVTSADDEHGAEPDRTAYDALVHLVRTA